MFRPQVALRLYDPVVAFYDLSAQQTADARDQIAAAALYTARLIATEHLIAGPASSAGDVEEAARLLIARDETDSRFELLRAFEKQWSLLVLNLIVGVVSDPSAAVRDARDRGASVAEIAATLHITEPAVYKRYGDHVVRRPRRRDD